MKLQHYALGQWIDPSGETIQLKDASNGQIIASAGTETPNIESMLNYARTKVCPTLRKLTFHERARALKALALHLLEHKEKFYQISYATGATKVDSWIDIEGGIGNLFVYSSKGRRELPDTPFCLQGQVEGLSKTGHFLGHHILTPKKGCAIHINAFNFPVWGMLEKFAVNFLAGVPAIVKPATVTSYLTEAVVQQIVSSNILPVGSLQLVIGPARDILDHIESQDVVTFTGSAQTGQKLRAHPRVNQYSVPFNMEADSLNSCVLAPDVEVDDPNFDIFVKEVSKEMTIKAGQKCTAIRRIIVPQNKIEAVSEAIKKRLAKVAIGDPRNKDVRMGPLASLDQQEEVQAKINELLKDQCEILYSEKSLNILGENTANGAFVSPTLLFCKDDQKNQKVHETEAFGPVSTLLGYQDFSEACEMVNKGQGSLVSSIVTQSSDYAREFCFESACYNGRILVLNKDCAKDSTGHGSPMPQLVHGGPGRAGGGLEMGGLRGLSHYMQTTAIQGHPTSLTGISQVYHPKAEVQFDHTHPFAKTFHQLQIGDTLVTHKRTITESDIVNFANLSWDHFYAHVDETSLKGTIFEKRVAHGYFVISAAAGLFVKSDKGPVLANYGLDDLRFLKPVYAGTTIGVRLTVKEKISQDPRPDESPRGIVKWLVDVYDDENETVALATILTLVAKDPIT